MGEMWEWIGRNRYGVTEPKFLRLRYGVQVNSLGLTESQPENNVPRIVLEALAVTLGRDARARAIQLPAWNEALGLPRPWDQQWSLRIQQILANETDLLEYPDIFEGSKVMDGLVAELVEGAKAEMKAVEEQGGAVEAVPYMKARLVESNRERIAKIERGEIVVVGQNKFTETEDSPLTTGEDGGILTPDPEVERERIAALEEWRSERDQARRRRRPRESRRGRPRRGREHHARDHGGRQGRRHDRRVGRRPARRLRRLPRADRRRGGSGGAAVNGDLLGEVRDRVKKVSEEIGHPIRILVGKPGLDGHSNGAEQIAVRARDVGMEVIYQGIRLTPEQIANSAVAGGRRRGRPLDPLRLPPRARPARGRASARAGRRHSRRGRRDHPGGRRRRHARGRRRRRLHAQGLRDQPDHGEIADLVAERAAPRAAAATAAESDVGVEAVDSRAAGTRRRWSRSLQAADGSTGRP